MLVNVQSADSLGKAILKAMSFPALIGGVMLMGVVIGNPDHSVSNTISELVFASLWVGLTSIPFIAFALLRRQALKSTSSTSVFSMSDRQSELLAAAFEKLDGQWVWYANAWARGVVVSAEEREIYLAFRPIAFRQAIRGRPASKPRRPYWPTLKRILTAIAVGRDPGAGRP